MQKVLLLLFSLFYLWNGVPLNVYEHANHRLESSNVSTFLMDPLSLISSDLSACESGSATLSVLINGGTGPYIYAWSGPNGFSSTNSNPTISNIAAADYGTYSVTVMDSTGDTVTSTLELITSDGCGEYLLVNGKKPVAKYTLDFNIDPPTFNFISEQLIEVTGNVLLNNGSGTDAGFDYTIQLSLEGGPDGSSVINFPSDSPLVPSRFQQSITKIGTSGGRTALVFAIEGRIGNDPITYMRDPSTKMTFNLSLENSVSFKNLTYELGDMDYNFVSSSPTNTCFLGGEPNDYRCRYSYIDRITFLSNPEDNDYIFDDTSAIHQSNVSQMYSQFKDANNNEIPDVADDGRIPAFSPDGNIKVCNSAIGNEITFVYDDPGFGIEGDADGFHDFDAKNQVMGFLSGMTFDLAGECNSTHYMLCDAEATLEADPTLTDIVWFNSLDEEVGQGVNLTLDSTSVVNSDSFYYIGTNSFGCVERLCCPLEVVRCCLKVNIGDQDQSIDLNTVPAPLSVNIERMEGDTLLYQWQSNTSGCSETFLNIPGATSPTYTPDTLSTTAYYRVLVSSVTGNVATCQVVSNCVTVSVMTRLGGCISEDTNRDNIQNDGVTPIENIPVLLYVSPDTMNPIRQTLTDADGKFLFDSLYGNTFYIQYAPPSEYKLPDLVEFTGLPEVEFGDTTFVGRSFGFLSTTNGFTEKIFVPDAFEYLNYDVLLTPCIPVTVDMQDTTIVLGDTLMATVTGPGNYTWTPSASLDCDTCSSVKLFPTETTTYQVNSGEECVCEGPSFTVTVLNAIGGCVREDINGDGIANDGSTPMENIEVSLYAEGDTINPIATIFTGPDGKYNFDSLPAGKYIVGVIPATDYSFPITAQPLGDLLTQNGFSDVYCLEGGDEELTEDALLGTCPTFDLPFREIQILPGDTVCVNIAQSGNYSWTPTTDIDCPTCQQVKITPDSSITYYVDRGVSNAYDCADSDSLTIIVLSTIEGEVLLEPEADGGTSPDDIPIDSIAIFIYPVDDPTNPFDSVFTADGTYAFDSIPDGKYFIVVDIPAGYILPISGITDANGMTDTICIDSGDEVIMPDVLIAECHTISLSLNSATIVPSDSVCVTISQDGNYSWSPTHDISCDTCQQVCIYPDSTTTYVVNWDNQNIYSCPHEAEITITVLSELGGCVREDVNRDGVANDGNTAMENIEVNLFAQGDTINPIATAFTTADGKYLFDSLPAGKYYASFIPANEFYFAPLFLEIGDMIARAGYSDLICLESGASDIIYDALLERCQSTQLSITEALAFSGDEVCITVSGAGNYTWTPAIPGYENCDTCTVFKILVDSSQTYTVSSQANNACSEDEAQLAITAAFINLADPCNCLGNQQFGELITVNSFSAGETWTYIAGTGLHDINDANTIIPFGTQMTYAGVGSNGFHIYELSGIHFDSIGYNSVFSNGEFELSIGHICYETEECNGLAIASLGGCVNEDFNRDGLDNDSLPPIENIEVYLYAEGDTITPIDSMLTDADGKYLFEDLVDGKYYVSFVAPADYLLSLQDLPVGNLTDRNGFTEVVCVGIAEDVRDVDALIEKCYETQLSINAAQAFSGQTVTVTVEGGGNYMWTPAIPGYENCDTCTVFDIVVDSSRIYTIKSTHEFACVGDETQLDITAAFINISDPCDCLGNKLFGELITINSFSAGETWTYFDGTGYYDRNDATTLIPFGTTMTYAGVGANGFHIYELPGIHIDSIGYTAHFTNGDFQLSISNLCYETDLCRNLPIASLGGCVNEDFNRDGLANDSLPPVENIVVYLYAETDTINPIDSTLTDVDGKYLFDELVDGKYYVFFTAPTDYLLSLQDLPVGNLTDRNGFTEVICVGIGENVRAVDALIETCYETELDIAAARVFSGQTVTITVEGPGSYEWTPEIPGYEDCDTCTVFSIIADSSRTYTVRSSSEHACVDDEVQLDITTAFVNIADPCNCLGNKEFGELITINSFSAGETWTYFDGTGYYDRNDASTLIPFGTTMTYAGVNADGFHIYELPGIHIDSIGYTAHFTNGLFDLSISNLCYETDLCRGLPLASISGCVNEDLNRDGVANDTNASFENIVVHLYEQGDTINPVASITTDPDGKYLFDGLIDGKYFVEFEAPVDYLYPNTTLPVGNLADSDGFTDLICLGIGEDKLDVDGLLGKCIGINILHKQFEILQGDTIMVSILDTGNYTWQPATNIDCPTCQDVKLYPTETTTYSIQWDDQSIYNCNYESWVTVTVIPCTIDNLSVGISDLSEYPNTVLSATASVHPHRGITYQWQSSHISCETGFADIIGANNSTYTINGNAAGQFFRVIATETGGAGACQLVSECIPLGSLGGCVNQQSQPLPNVTINLYDANNLNTPISSTTTGINGKYNFIDLPEGKFIVEIVTPNGLLFPLEGYPFGNLALNNGYTDIICVESGEQRNDIDVDLGSCNLVTPIASSLQITSGESAILTTSGGGFYTISSQEGVLCNSCTSVEVSPSETTIYSIGRLNGVYGCSERSTVKIEVLKPYVATSEPCNCYGGFIFEESVTIYSHRANEMWVVSENDGLYFEGLPLVAIPVGTEIPYTGVNEEGMHTYTISGMHKNEIGYQISFEKEQGFDTEEDKRLSSSRSSGMTIGNFCMLDEVCPEEEVVEEIPEFDPEATPAFPGNIESECIKPSIYAIHGVAIDLMQSGMVEVWAKDFLHKSLHPCLDAGKLIVKAWHVGMLIDLPLSADDMKDMNDNLVFTCDHLGTQEIRLFVADEEGNVNFVTTYIIIQDNLGACATDSESMATISGTISDWKGKEIQRVSVLSKQTDDLEMGAMTTTNDGTYSFNLPMSSDYTVHPTKDINPLNGVSTFDLVLISKHILGITTFQNPHQWIAADVNQSGSITAFDMVQIRRLILNIDEQFSNNTSWKFVEKDFEFTASNPLADQFPEIGQIANLHQDMQMDFVGIKIGDVNGSAQPNSLQATTVRTSPEVFTIEVEDHIIKKGETVEVVFSTSQIQDIEGYQFTMNYEGLQVNNLTGDLMAVENFGLHLLEKGLLTASWNHPTTSKASSKGKMGLFTVHFQANRSGKLSDLLQLQSLPTAVEAYDEQGNTLAVALQFNEAIASKTFELYQNQPNPFYKETSISFYLPTDSEVELILRDETGRVLQTQKEFKAGGLNEMILRDISSNKGFIYYQLNTKFGSKIKKMIQIR